MNEKCHFCGGDVDYIVCNKQTCQDEYKKQYEQLKRKADNQSNLAFYIFLVIIVLCVIFVFFSKEILGFF